MATVSIQNAEIRNNEQFDLWVFAPSGKVRVAFNVSVDGNGNTTLTYSAADNATVEIVKVKGE